jgi:hypothetical protein
MLAVLSGAHGAEQERSRLSVECFTVARLAQRSQVFPPSTADRPPKKQRRLATQFSGE